VGHLRQAGAVDLDDEDLAIGVEVEAAGVRGVLGVSTAVRRAERFLAVLA
jgi:hypothetical protein